MLKANGPPNSEDKKYPHFITSFVKGFYQFEIHESKKAPAATDANFLNTENIYSGAKSSVVGMRLPITLKAMSPVRVRIKTNPTETGSDLCWETTKRDGCYILYTLFSYVDIFIPL